MPPHFVDALCWHKKTTNIKCLSLFNNSEQLRGTFKGLEELRLGPYNAYEEDWGVSTDLEEEILEADDISAKENSERRECWIPEFEEAYAQEDRSSLLNAKRFPRLKSLHLHGPSGSTESRISRREFFPPLQTLHIQDGGQWFSIINNCAGTLTTLAIDFISEYVIPSGLPPITLSSLNSLSYVLRCPLDHDNMT
jgi:hypothetical protein